MNPLLPPPPGQQVWQNPILLSHILNPDDMPIEFRRPKSNHLEVDQRGSINWSVTRSVMEASRVGLEVGAGIMYARESELPTGIRAVGLKGFLEARGCSEERIETYISKLRYLDEGPDLSNNQEVNMITPLNCTDINFSGLTSWLRSKITTHPSLSHFRIAIREPTFRLDLWRDVHADTYFAMGITLWRDADPLWDISRLVAAVSQQLTGSETETIPLVQIGSHRRFGLLSQPSWTFQGDKSLTCHNYSALKEIHIDVTPEIGHAGILPHLLANAPELKKLSMHIEYRHRAFPRISSLLGDKPIATLQSLTIRSALMLDGDLFDFFPTLDHITTTCPSLTHLALPIRFPRHPLSAIPGQSNTPPTHRTRHTRPWSDTLRSLRFHYGTAGMSLPPVHSLAYLLFRQFDLRKTRISGEVIWPDVFDSDYRNPFEEDPDTRPHAARQQAWWEDVMEFVNVLQEQDWSGIEEEEVVEGEVKKGWRHVGEA